MLGDDEVIVLAVYEEGRNEGILDVLDGVQLFNIEVVLPRGGFTFSFMVDSMKDSAIPLNTDSLPPCLSANYFDSFSKLEKGESRTTHPIS